MYETGRVDEIDAAKQVVEECDDVILGEINFVCGLHQSFHIRLLVMHHKEYECTLVISRTFRMDHVNNSTRVQIIFHL